MGLATQLRSRIINWRLHRRRRDAETEMRRNDGLWQMLTAYLKQTGSTGVEWSDYLTLYRHVRTARPTEILECGTGASTVVLAYALMENHVEGGPAGRVTSMEDKEQWWRMAAELLPEPLKPYVNLMLSPLLDDAWSLFRGVRYETVPDHPYTFVFVDGPDFNALSDNALTFDLDLIRVVERSEVPVFAVIDDRLSTNWVMQQVFGEKARYETSLRLGFVGPVTKADLCAMHVQKPCFIDSFRALGDSRLQLRLLPAKR